MRTLMILGRPLLLIIALLMLAAVMSGCATTKGFVIDDELLTCMPAPASPADDPNATDEDGALYLIELGTAGQDCRSKLGSVRELVRPETTK
jgi:hypothetical protein